MAVSSAQNLVMLLFLNITLSPAEAGHFEVYNADRLALLFFYGNEYEDPMIEQRRYSRKVKRIHIRFYFFE